MAPIRSRPTACCACRRVGANRDTDRTGVRTPLEAAGGAAVGSDQRTRDLRVSPTDPDATPMRIPAGTSLGYHDHYVVDGGKARITLATLVTPAEVMENPPMRDLLWRLCSRWKLRPPQVTGDTTSGTIEIIVAVEDAGIRADLPLPDFDHRTALFGRERFTDEAERDSYHCPGGRELRFRTHKHDATGRPARPRSPVPSRWTGSGTLPTARTPRRRR
jgi:hypothetical protein